MKFTGNSQDADAEKLFQKATLVPLSIRVQSDISTTSVPQIIKVFNLNCITAGVDKFI